MYRLYLLSINLSVLSWHTEEECRIVSSIPEPKPKLNYWVSIPEPKPNLNYWVSIPEPKPKLNYWVSIPEPKPKPIKLLGN